MTLKPMIWSGYGYTLRIRRYWNVFFGFAPCCEMKALQKTIWLPREAGYHFQPLYNLAVEARQHFKTADQWFTFLCALCDEYCDCYVIRRCKDGNVFADFGHLENGHFAVREFASKCRGYAGPDPLYPPGKQPPHPAAP